MGKTRSSNLYILHLHFTPTFYPYILHSEPAINTFSFTCDEMRRKIQEKSSGIHCQYMAKANHTSLNFQPRKISKTTVLSPTTDLCAFTKCYHGKHPEKPGPHNQFVVKITHSFSSFPGLGHRFFPGGIISGIHSFVHEQRLFAYSGGYGNMGYLNQLILIYSFLSYLFYQNTPI